MNVDKRRKAEENKIVTGLINALLLGVAWWSIILFVVVEVAGK